MKKLSRDGGNDGWTIKFKVIMCIKEQAENMEDVAMEQVEAVALAMVDLGYVEMEARP